MPRSTDDLTEFATRSRSTIRPVEWTFMALCLGLAGVLLLSGLLPARKRHESLRDRNRNLHREIRRIDQENQHRAEHISDVLQDRLTIETELRNRGGVEPDEELLPSAPPPVSPPRAGRPAVLPVTVPDSPAPSRSPGYNGRRRDHGQPEAPGLTPAR